MDKDKVNGIEYEYSESQVRVIPEGQSSLTVFERVVLDLMDEGYTFDEAVDEAISKGTTPTQLGV